MSAAARASQLGLASTRRSLRLLPIHQRLSSTPVRAQCLHLHRPTSPTLTLRRTYWREQPSSTGRAVEKFDLGRMRNESYEYQVRRRNFLLSGAITGVIAFCYVAYLLVLAIRKERQEKEKAEGKNKFDSGLPAGADPFTIDGGSKRKTVLHDAEGREIVPTGNSTVPTFPRLLDLAFGAVEESSGPGIVGVEQAKGSDVEYTLVGLGVRTVTFLGIQVYMVGYYVATQDIAAIQSRLVKEINPIATTLVASEKETLRKVLLDPEQGEKLWNSILLDVRPRSVFRIVPVRDTDFHHLRDGFVRAITARSQRDAQEYGDETFGVAMKEFKTLFNRGKVPKSRELLLCRDAAGRLSVAYNGNANASEGQTTTPGQGLGTIGRIDDERISRLLWLNYVAGKNVASEPARTNIVDGIMEFVERPIGTVAARVI
ncbi:chalcone-flavanone isomerase-domain-containing protein [Nemania sp. FL0916]|nr:chalcone-flavanone isomerase-domain-containing protein [Nemania sp. FL0916]